jgi:hypothetical protein
VRSQLTIAAIAAFLVPVAVRADDKTPPVVDGHTYVQHLIVAAKARHPDVAAITVISKREKGDGMLVLGSTADRARVMTTVAKPTADAVAGSTVREAFNSNSGHRLGTIEIVFNGAANAATAAEVQADLAKATLSAKNAADPWPFDQGYGPDTYAQTLTMKTVAKHPDLLVMMIHATPPAGKHNVIIGSNIGRFGKEADEDDLRVIDKGSTNLEIGGDSDRFETELPLNDAGGHRIGALGLVFPFKAGDDKEAIHRRGLAIRNEVAAAIPNSAALFARAK